MVGCTSYILSVCCVVISDVSWDDLPCQVISNSAKFYRLFQTFKGDTFMKFTKSGNINRAISSHK
jgi:hypothetical protein